MRGSAKNLLELGTLRESGSLEQAMNDFSIKKKQTRVNGVQLAPLNHPTTSLKSNVNILSQNRTSIGPLSSRAAANDAMSSGGGNNGYGGATKITASDINTMSMLQKELLSASNLSPHVASKGALLTQIPLNAGLQKPPLSL